MTDTRVALAPDRLPWLQDVPERRHSSRRFWAWVAAVVMLVAGASYWLGVQRGIGEQEPEGSVPAQRTVTAPLPEPQILPPASQVPIAPVPQAEPTPLPEVRRVPAPAVKPSSRPRSIGRKAGPVAAEKAAAEKRDRKSVV